MMPAPRRPVPADFLEKAAGMSLNQLCDHYNAGRTAVRRWEQEAGVDRRVFTPAKRPDDFEVIAPGKSIRQIAEHYGVTFRIARRWTGGGEYIPRNRPCPDDFREYAVSLSVSQLADHYRTGLKVVLRWLDECGLPAIRIQSARPVQALDVPQDFAETAATMHTAALARHYDVCEKIVRRWIAETGVKPKAYVATGNPSSRVKAGLGFIPIKNSFGNLVPTRVRSMMDDAADVLRRERFKVNRCNPKGEYDPKGNLWRCGWSILTDDELLAKADRYRSRAA